MEDTEKDSEKESKKGVSRREFVASVGSAVAGLVVGGVVGSQVFPKAERFQCPYCDRVFDSESALGDHIKAAHPDLLTKEVAKYSCPYCAQEFTSAAALGEHIKTAHLDLIMKEVEKPPQSIKLTVNGEQHEFLVGDEVDANTTLWELLREKLGYTSVREMCMGKGACGSCTVIVNGRPVLSCMTLALLCDGATIETVEGIAKAGHPIVEAWAKHYAFQCGYCTPGAVVTAKALLDRNRNPTDEEIIEALSGNLCRCHTYPTWLLAVKEAAEKLRGRR